MSFRIAEFKTLLLAMLICGLVPAAKAQSAAGTQHIIFSSPGGQITSNAPLPMAQAPETQETPNLPDDQGAIHPYSEPMPPASPMFPQPPPMMPDDNSQSGDDDFQNIRKQMGSLTAAQIMKVPTPEEIFGLAEKPDETQKNLDEPDNTDSADNADNAHTNDLVSETNTIFAAPGWAKVWTEDTGRSTESSNTTENTSGFFGGFFDTARTDNGPGNRNASGLETLFGQSQPESQPASSSWETALSSGDLTPPAPAESANNFGASGIALSPDFTSQSPFTPPRVSSLETLPQLPTLPSLSGQNNSLTLPAAPATPSWAPKAPPWTQAQTPFGTAVKTP